MNTAAPTRLLTIGRCDASVTGKSNTIKTLVTAVHRYGSEHNQSIGQVIFDPQGEYANINKQDRTGLRRQLRMSREPEMQKSCGHRVGRKSPQGRNRQLYRHAGI